MNKAQDLPVPVRGYPHWRVLIRPAVYNEENLESLGKCWQVIEQNRVRLRGWSYPHLSSRETERENGSNWVASWSDFMGHLEYWRLYQSAQFVHLFSVREATEAAWRAKLLSVTKSHLSLSKDMDWNSVPGFIHITNFIYSMTEIFEFAARMAQVGSFGDQFEIAVQLDGIKGFVLTTDWDRAWHSYYAASQDNLAKTWQVNVNDLISDTAGKSLDAVIWFFDRFGWHNPPVEILREDQSDFLKGRR